MDFLLSLDRLLVLLWQSTIATDFNNEPFFVRWTFRSHHTHLRIYAVWVVLAIYRFLLLSTTRYVALFPVLACVGYLGYPFQYRCAYDKLYFCLFLFIHNGQGFPHRSFPSYFRTDIPM